MGVLILILEVCVCVSGLKVPSLKLRFQAKNEEKYLITLDIALFSSWVSEDNWITVKQYPLSPNSQHKKLIDTDDRCSLAQPLNPPICCSKQIKKILGP